MHYLLFWILHLHDLCICRCDNKARQIKEKEGDKGERQKRKKRKTMKRMNKREI